MLILGILLGLLLGLLAGGSLANLARSACAGSACSFGGHPPVRHGDPAERRRSGRRAPCACRCSPAFGMLLVGLWANREYPGLGLAFVGILSNAAVIVVNGGYMPIWEPSLSRPASHRRTSPPPST